MGNNEVKFFLHSPENYTHSCVHRKRKKSFCFVLPFKEKLLSASLAITFVKVSTSLYFMHPMGHPFIVRSGFYSNRLHRHCLLYRSYLEKRESEDLIIYSIQFRQH